MKQVIAICSSRVRMNTWPRIIKSRRKRKQISKNELKQTVLVSKSREPEALCVYRGRGRQGGCGLEQQQVSG